MVFLFLVFAACAWGGDKASLSAPMRYHGMADASGAVAVGTNLFVAADDEDNTLRLYRSDQAGPPLKQFDCNAFLEVHGKSLEADLEAGARLGDRAFWIGSHGRNRNGKGRSNRCRLFATDIKVENGEVTLTPVGKSYKSLLDDLIGDPRFERLHLAAAARLAPKEANALNIEGLSATAEGQLLLGFRNPIPEGKALLIPLLNPNEVVEGQAARLGSAMQLDLGGLGIRDIAFYQGTYLIIAGPYHGGGPFKIYRWAGGHSEPERLHGLDFGDAHPEALIIYPQNGLRDIQILSDDGKLDTDGDPNRELPMPQRTFRSFWVRTGWSY
jgi:hypothetical protein